MRVWKSIGRGGKSRLLAALVAMLPGGAHSANVFVDDCGAAIDSIKSYNVVFRLSFYQYNDLDDLQKPDNIPSVAFETTNRDVFAIGLGRRVERNIGDASSEDIGVIDWKTIKAKGKPLSRAVRNTLPGLTYHDYLNPDNNGPFLSDLLKDDHSRISEIAPFNESGETYPGFRLTNIKLRGEIRLWLATTHGCMPVKVEFYEKTRNGALVLVRKIHVEQFMETDIGNWVPSVAVNQRISDSGSNMGRAYSGQKIELNAKDCSWNSVSNDALFLAKNLTNKNYSEDGWNRAESPILLNALRRADQSVASATAKGRLSTLIGIVLIAAPLIIAFLITVNKRKKITV